MYIYNFLPDCIDLNLFLCLFVGYMLMWSNRSTIDSTLPVLVSDDSIHWDFNLAGKVFAFGNISYLIGKLCAGTVVKRFNAVNVFLVAAVFMFITNSLISIQISFWGVGILWVFFRFFMSLTWPCMTQIISQVAPPSVCGRIFGFLSVSSRVGVLLGGLVVGQLLSIGIPWRLNFIFSSSLLLWFFNWAAYRFAALRLIDLPNEMSIKKSTPSSSSENSQGLFTWIFNKVSSFFFLFKNMFSLLIFLLSSPSRPLTEDPAEFGLNSIASVKERGGEMIVADEGEDDDDDEKKGLISSPRLSHSSTLRTTSFVESAKMSSSPLNPQVIGASFYLSDKQGTSRNPAIELKDIQTSVDGGAFSSLPSSSSYTTPQQQPHQPTIIQQQEHLCAPSSNSQTTIPNVSFFSLLKQSPVLLCAFGIALLTPISEMTSWWVAIMSANLRTDAGDVSVLVSFFPLSFIVAMLTFSPIYDRATRPKRLLLIVGCLVGLTSSLLGMRLVISNLGSKMTNLEKATLEMRANLFRLEPDVLAGLTGDDDRSGDRSTSKMAIHSTWAFNPHSTLLTKHNNLNSLTQNQYDGGLMELIDSVFQSSRRDSEQKKKNQEEEELRNEKTLLMVERMMRANINDDDGAWLSRLPTHVLQARQDLNTSLENSRLILGFLIGAVGFFVGPPFFLPVSVLAVHYKQHAAKLSGVLDAAGYVTTTIIMSWVGSWAQQEAWGQIFDTMICMSLLAIVVFYFLMKLNITGNFC
eukprot:GDKJ01007562.1.p1 GENE.GDKJ01007562.1~~GDKJ01007562.1.p1  ORF type:complete len:748 (+),score=173.52 GDKJ01007562.1:47-2290(+)